MVALLAWLDYCVQHTMDFNKTIVDHLRKVKRGSGKDEELSMVRIHAKLRHLKVRYSPESSMSNVRALGSREFEGLPGDTRKDVEAALASYNDEYNDRETMSNPNSTRRSTHMSSDRLESQKHPYGHSVLPSSEDRPQVT